MPYEELAHRLLEAHQIIVSLAGLGIMACVALWVLWGRYEEVMAFIRDDGIQGRLAQYKVKQERIRRIKRGECPSHGTPLHMSGGKCPVKGCKETPERR